mgnify:CR=1 FL=1
MKQKQILALLQDMSLTEKIGQMVQMVGMLYDAKEQGIITGPMMEGNGGRFEDGGLQSSFIWRGKACQDPEKLYGKPAASYSADVYV